MDHNRARARRNRTLVLSTQDRMRLAGSLLSELPAHELPLPPEGLIYGDFAQWTKLLPRGFVDLLILDPPYNLDKSFNGLSFGQTSVDAYTQWLNDVLGKLKPLLKPTSSIYICGEWLTSASIFEAAGRHFVIRNRITWEREKGRGAKRNWKNSSEDIWFCTMGNEYYFDVDAVKLRRRVLAPYTHGDGSPKDWSRTDSGDYRDTHPSNLWTDITVPFWSMRENTDHPTQKSEKLIAKLILASTAEDAFVFDPFAGSGTTCVVAKKLGRRYLGIEIDKDYCLLALRRLELAETDRRIQGWTDNVFWERNSGPTQQRSARRAPIPEDKRPNLFD